MALSERLLAAQRSREGSTTPEQKAPDGPAPDGRRVRRITAPDPFGELKRVVHAQLVGTLGPKLYDANMTQSELEQQVRAALQTRSRRPTSRCPARTGPGSPRRSPTRSSATARSSRYLRDPDVTEVMVNGARRDLRRARRQAQPVDAAFTDEAHLRRTIDKIVGTGRPAGRRVQPDGRRPAARRQPGQRHHPAAGPGRLRADDPQVRRRPVHRRGPDRVRHADPAGRRPARRLRAGAAEHPGLRRHRRRARPRR